MFFRFLSCLCLWSAWASAADEAGFILARELILADPHPDGRLPAASELSARFRASFTRAFPARIVQAQPGVSFQTDQQVVLIVPRVTAARLAHEVVDGGRLHEWIPLIAGSIEAVDPWSGAMLFAATSSAAPIVKTGSSDANPSEAKISGFFSTSLDLWMRECFQKLDTQLRVFTLRAATVSAPREADRSPGGIWPFGREDGVRANAVLTGVAGRAARVIAVFSHYSFVGDPSAPERVIPAGEMYRLPVARSPVNRREPRVEVTWTGPPPQTLPVNDAPGLSAEGESAVFLDSLGRNSTLRLLPLALQDPVAQAAVDRSITEVTQSLGLVERGPLLMHPETFRNLSIENPDFRVALFAVEPYAGAVRKPDWVEHRYRATLGAAIFARHGDEDRAVYGLVRVVLRHATVARNARAGVRDIDPRHSIAAAWRNAALGLAQDVLNSNAFADGSVAEPVEAVVGPDRQAVWPAGSEPDLHAPLQWTRPAGQISLPDGAASYFQVIAPKQGYLTGAALAGEALRPGDRLRYLRLGNRRNLAALRFDVASDGGTLIALEAWKLLAANALGGALRRELVVPGIGGPGQTPDGLPVVICHLSALSELPAASETPAITADWRVTLLGVRGDRRAALGRRIAIATARNPLGLVPPDLASTRLTYAQEAVGQLAGFLAAEGFDTRELEGPTKQ
jgi:hypothetical protein